MLLGCGGLNYVLLSESDFPQDVSVWRAETETGITSLSVKTRPSGVNLVIYRDRCVYYSGWTPCYLNPIAPGKYKLSFYKGKEFRRLSFELVIMQGYSYRVRAMLRPDIPDRPPLPGPVLDF